jgi:hypothetical protein
VEEAVISAITATTYALHWQKSRKGEYYALTYAGAVNAWSPTGSYQAEFADTRWRVSHVDYTTNGNHEVRRVPGIWTTLKAAKAAAEADQRAL